MKGTVEKESDTLHQQHLTWTGTRTDCGSGIQAALNMEAIRSLVHQMVLTSLDSYSLISCEERLSLSFPLCSNSVSVPEQAPQWMVVEFITRTRFVLRRLWLVLPQWQLTDVVLNISEAVNVLKTLLVLVVLHNVFKTQPDLHMIYNYCNGGCIWNTYGMKHLVVCCFRKIIRDGVVLWLGVTATMLIIFFLYQSNYIY